MTKKKCARCQETKMVSEYHKHKNNQDGLQGWCKSCMSEYSSNYRRTYTKELLEEAMGVRVEVRNYFYRKGAYLDQESGHAGFLRTNEICDEFGWSTRKWSMIRCALIRLGEPITVSMFGGHHYGLDGDPAKHAVRLIATGLSLFKHGTQILSAILESGEWDKALPKFHQALEKSRHDLAPRDLLEIVETLDYDDSVEHWGDFSSAIQRLPMK